MTYSKNEALYKMEMRQSLLAITHKKSGWDCLRHNEIVANGSCTHTHTLRAHPLMQLMTYPSCINPSPPFSSFHPPTHHLHRSSTSLHQHRAMSTVCSGLASQIVISTNNEDGRFSYPLPLSLSLSLTISLSLSLYLPLPYLKPYPTSTSPSILPLPYFCPLLRVIPCRTKIQYAYLYIREPSFVPGCFRSSILSRLIDGIIAVHKECTVYRGCRTICFTHHDKHPQYPQQHPQHPQYPLILLHTGNR